MFAKHPDIAKRFAVETPDMKNLPEKKGPKKKIRFKMASKGGY